MQKAYYLQLTTLKTTLGTIQHFLLYDNNDKDNSENIVLQSKFGSVSFGSRQYGAVINYLDLDIPKMDNEMVIVSKRRHCSGVNVCSCGVVHPGMTGKLFGKETDRICHACDRKSVYQACNCRVFFYFIKYEGKVYGRLKISNEHSHPFNTYQATHFLTHEKQIIQSQSIKYPFMLVRQMMNKPLEDGSTMMDSPKFANIDKVASIKKKVKRVELAADDGKLREYDISCSHLWTFEPYSGGDKVACISYCSEAMVELYYAGMKGGFQVDMTFKS